MKSLLLEHPKTVTIQVDRAAMSDQDIVMVPTFRDALNIYGSIPLRRGLGIKEKIDEEILKMRQEGLIDKILKKWYRSSAPFVGNVENRSIGYSDVVLPVCIFFVGLFAAVAIALTEALFPVKPIYCSIWDRMIL